jgi:hypothetical protein
MVRFSSQQGCLFKIWQFLMLLWEIVKLFVVSLFRGNPRDARKADATPFRTSSYRPGGGGGGGGGVCIENTIGHITDSDIETDETHLWLGCGVGYL